MTTDPGAEWGAVRRPGRVLHLDSAAAGRQSPATLAATAAHARAEAETGAYVAQAEAAPLLDDLRRDVGALLGVRAESVAFVESATAALTALLRTWPLPDDASVGVLPVEWGPNLDAFADRGLRRVALPADEFGALDLEAFARLLSDSPPSVVHLTQVTSHRGLLQPVAGAAALCRAAGIPLWVDAAQAVGHVDTAVGADAVYATSRKWLAGPRGVGALGIGEAYADSLRVRRPALLGADLPAVAYLESQEAHVAGRVGLATAVREHLALGPAAVHARLDEVGALTRTALAALSGWAVTPGSRSAITALAPLHGQDVAEVRARLLAEHRILVTAGATARSPGDMRTPLLRVSPHVDVTADELGRLVEALADVDR